jgi:trehalose/maltose hydrolase-like predicted phosphorylase
VLDPALAGEMRQWRATKPAERYLFVAEGGNSIVEVTEEGARRFGSGDLEGLDPMLSSVLRSLSDEGIHGGHTVVVGRSQRIPDDYSQIPGDEEVIPFLEDQISRIDSLQLPAVGPDPSWTVRFRNSDHALRVREALCTVANGHIGARGSAEEEPPGSDPLLLAAGVYDDQEPPSLLEGPRWTRLPLRSAETIDDEWVLDMRGGVLARRRETDIGVLATLRLVSAERPPCSVLLAEGHRELFDLDRPGANGLMDGMRPVSEAGVVSSRGSIAAVASEEVVYQDTTCSVERVVAYETRSSRLVTSRDPKDSLTELTDLGSHRLLLEHRSAWARRWRGASVEIEGDQEAELAVRFAIYHLLGSAAPESESAVGARGLTGVAYRGHVFWDTDVFVLPALAAVFPDAARTMLEYRVARLPAARDEARRQGYEGARFPWESADDGRDVTPSRFTNTEGESLPVRTGRCEEHIVADVAWAARHYASWTGDWEYLLRGPGRQLIDDTARYWASRIRVDSEGRGHIEDVIGPDEYHEGVDDNAFTNVMARANLRWAIGIDQLQGARDPGEVSKWSDLAARLVDGYDPGTGLYRQFTGYDDLEPMLAEDVASPPIAADLLLGRRIVEASQLVKQADVLMLHHMVPEEVAPGSLVPNLDYYLPRTTHGSSLSPAIHASLLARAGRVEDALEWFRLASRLDLDDLTGTTAGGIHLATMGGLWQALAFGFMGLDVGRGGIGLDPRLPAAWSSLTMSLTALQSLMTLRANADEVEVESEHPLLIRCGDARTMEPAFKARFSLVSGVWKETT